MFKMWFGPLLILMPKLYPGLPEARFGLGTPEKNAKAEPKVDGGCRARSSSSIPTSPKPLLQSPKPSPGPRPSIPQKPRTASRPEDTPDSPSGPSSPKVALLPPILKKVPSDKERDGQNSPQPSPRTFSQEGKNIFPLALFTPESVISKGGA
ncbi:hypothetical protein U0070_011471 [Myodes glareolus]|uniref:Uncharacterized protein n=1 Tax=Myodes glareolus TaxID=447135 RepID=A0AAW0HKH4_MYOGA